jgi:endonuclease YncB( thermonuclease family)
VAVPIRPPRRHRSSLLLGAVLMTALPACTATTGGPGTTATSRDRELLRVTDQKDGDSFEASDGREYRVGMIDTPEPGERCHDEATVFTRDFLADGFTADVYDEDGYGRAVAEVRDRDGRSLNIALARSGLAGDRYLDIFRDDAPDLAARLDRAFASADRPSCR